MIGGFTMSNLKNNKDKNDLQIGEYIAIGVAIGIAMDAGTSKIRRRND